MPAAAVIPAPIAYIKVVAVKKLVVESVCHTVGSPLAVLTDMLCGTSYRWVVYIMRILCCIYTHLYVCCTDKCLAVKNGGSPQLQSRRGPLN